MKKALLSLFVAGVAALGFVNIQVHSAVPIRSKLSVKNINLMQANAGEITCDNVNNVRCTIKVGDPPIEAIAYGPVHVY